MNLDGEDVTSVQGGSSEVASEAAGAVTMVDSSLAVPEENKNGESNSSSESGLEVDRVSLGRDSGASESEKELDPAEMVRAGYLCKSSNFRVNLLIYFVPSLGTFAEEAFATFCSVLELVLRMISLSLILEA